jgi:hypothetical protein
MSYFGSVVILVFNSPTASSEMICGIAGFLIHFSKPLTKRILTLPSFSYTVSQAISISPSLVWYVAKLIRGGSSSGSNGSLNALISLIAGSRGRSVV